MAYPALASLVATSWITKVYLIMKTIADDAGSYTPMRPKLSCLIGIVIALASILLSLFSVSSLGFKRLLGGKVFDYDLAAPPKGIIHDAIDSPNYTACAFFILACSLLSNSSKGIYLSLIICVIYCISGQVEDALSRKIYHNHKQKSSTSNSSTASSTSTSKKHHNRKSK